MPDRLLVATFAGAAAVTSVLTPAVAALARSLGVLDLPGGRRIHANPVPRIGGVAVFAGLAVGALVYGLSFGWDQFRWVHNELLAFLLPCLLVFGVGLVDDVRGLGPTAKLLGQAVAATFLIQAGYVVDDLANPFGAPISLGPAAFPLTLLWFVAVTNAFNLIDGIDGLLATVAVAALLGCAAIAIHGDRQAIALLSLALAGALVGFLPWNWNPARVFLGDSGSLVIGLAIAALSIKVCRNPVTPVAPNGTLAIHAPLLLCALPLVEMTLTVARRFVSGRPFFVGDKSHIHHVLLSKGLSVRRATLSLATIAFLFSATAVLSRSWRKEVVLGSLVVLLCAALGGMRWLGYVELQVAVDRLRRIVKSRRTELPLALALAHSGGHLRVASGLAEVRATLRALFDGPGLEYLGVELDPDLQAVIGEPPAVEPASADVQSLVKVTGARLLVGLARPGALSPDEATVPRTLVVFSLPLPLFEGRWARLLCVYLQPPGGAVPNESDLRAYVAAPLADALRRLTLGHVEHRA